MLDDVVTNTDAIDPHMEQIKRRQSFISHPLFGFFWPHPKSCTDTLWVFRLVFTRKVFLEDIDGYPMDPKARVSASHR
jgi:hypothetical protein